MTRRRHRLSCRATPRPSYFKYMAYVLAFAIAIIAHGLPGKVLAQDNEAGSYPAPRFPKWLVQPTDEKMMDAARLAVRQTGGLSPLGNAEPGQTVHVFLHYSQDMDVWEAIRQAFAERGVEAIPVYGWEAVGMTKEAYEKRSQNNIIKGPDGWKEFGAFESLYMPFLPEEAQEAIGDPLTVLWRYTYYRDFMNNHPEIEHVFVGSGGGKFFWALFAGQQHADKFLGNWAYLNKIDLLSYLGSFPPDVWKMIDEQIVRPIPHVAEGTFTDPNGTDLHYVMTPQQSEAWEMTSGLTNYQPGHLNIYPSAHHATWKKGIIRAGANHTAFMPVMTVSLSEHGRVTSIEGGGRAGDLFRHLLNHPKFRDAEFPTAPEKGYWYLTPDGLGTNPKAVRNMQKLTEGTIEMANLSERYRAGIQHFSFSSPVGITAERDPRDVEYAEERGIPLRHTGHMHVYFGTVKWKLRDTGEWITIVDKSRLAVFDNPELRALASRYGDPETIFKYDWVPHVPGINAPGNYEEDYASDPWAHVLSIWEKIKDGTYQYYIDEYQLISDPS